MSIVEGDDGSGEALSDPDFVALRESKGWPSLENLIIKNYCKTNKITIKDSAYAKTLWYMGAADQAYYDELGIAEKQIGKSSAGGDNF